MRLGWQQLVILLITSVAILQIFHMFLLNLVDQRENYPIASMSEKMPPQMLKVNSRRHSTSSRSDDDCMSSLMRKDFLDILNIIRVSSVLDSSGEYKIVNYLNGQLQRNARADIEQDVTLVSQCSGDHLANLITMAEYWNGKISVAVFVTSRNFLQSILAICKLRQCSYIEDNRLRNNISYHLVYPLKDHGAIENFPDSIQLEDLKWTCILPIDHKFVSTSAFNDRPPANYELSSDLEGEVPYPNNLMRNVARRTILTEFIFVIDVDMVPSKDLRERFLKFVETKNDLYFNKEKTVYVVPVYEWAMPNSTSETIEVMPENKAQLLAAIRNSRARPFYHEVCAKCQIFTDYNAWEKAVNSNESELGVLYDVVWKDPWEPFYMAHNQVPAYDERFKQYGFNRISQVCETYIAGYRFSVLNNAFLVHKGLKIMDSFHKRKDSEQNRNRILFRQFKQELKDKYPESSRRCY